MVSKRATPPIGSKVMSAGHQAVPQLVKRDTQKEQQNRDGRIRCAAHPSRVTRPLGRGPEDDEDKGEVDFDVDPADSPDFKRPFQAIRLPIKSYAL
jgi:hypothetical protein